VVCARTSSSSSLGFFYGLLSLVDSHLIRVQFNMDLFGVLAVWLWGFNGPKQAGVAFGMSTAALWAGDEAKVVLTEPAQM
jgi:hypothetical protein